MTDPVQLLIEAGAIPASPFAPNSRYANVAILRYQQSPSTPGVPYLARRFLPRLSDIAIAAEHLVNAGDRIDLLAARYFGDAELHWRIADANGAGDMLALTATPGDRISIPQPSGAGGT